MSKFVTRSNLSRSIQAFAVAAVLVTGMSATISAMSGDQAQAAAAGGGRGGGGGGGGGSAGGGGKGGGGDGSDGPKICLTNCAITEINLPTYPNPKPRLKPVKIERNCSTYRVEYGRPVCKDDTRF
ncbi:hypothetical protein [Flaviflagellibacter deserti]|uniref:Uncharacterized protein n=1 Tax=Flaviflagellibacter deserti TaxID=2267266 RepID=A0ABV9YY32_9HYPH